MPNNPVNTGLQAGALELVRNSHVMTLATAFDEMPWAAPVYYYYSNRAFFFFSSETSRHIRDAFNSSGNCSASIYEDPYHFETGKAVLPDEGTSVSSGFERIKGIQMTGRMAAVPHSVEALRTAVKYVKRFGLPFTGGSDCLIQIERAYHARMYRYLPDRVFFLDNSMGLGKRREISL